MKKFALILAAAAAAAALAPVTAAVAADTVAAETAGVAAPVVGKMLYSTGGKKLAPVYKLDATSAPQIMLEGKLVTVPVATLTTVDGHVETSLSRKDLMTRR